MRKPKIIKFHYSLDDPDSIRRCALGGLYRYLKWGPETRDHNGDPIFPAVAAFKGNIKITDTEISIAGTIEEIAALAEGMIGTLALGIIVPPGYPHPKMIPWYITARAHLGIATIFAGESSGGKRSKSLGKESWICPSPKRALALRDMVGATVTEITSQSGKITYRIELDHLLELAGYKPGWLANVVREVPFGISEDEEQTAATKKADITPHMPVTVCIGGVGYSLSPAFHYTGMIKGKSSLHGGYHPSTTKWNDKAPTVDPETAFLLYFSPFGHIYTWTEEGALGLGADAATFDEIDDFHTIALNGVGPDITHPESWAGGLFSIHNGAEVGAIMMATLLDFPEDQELAYVLQQEKGAVHRVISLEDLDSSLIGHFRKVLLDDLSGTLQRLLLQSKKNPGSYLIPALKGRPLVPPKPKKEGKDSKRPITIYSQVAENIRCHSPWYRGLHPLYQYLLKGPPSLTELSEPEKNRRWQKQLSQVGEVVTRLIKIMNQGDPMKPEYEFWKLCQAVKWRHFHNIFADSGSSSDRKLKAEKRMYQDILVRWGLRHARTTDELFRVISQATMYANSGPNTATKQYNKQNLSWDSIQLLQEDPTHWRDLMILSMFIEDATEFGIATQKEQP